MPYIWLYDYNIYIYIIVYILTIILEIENLSIENFKSQY